MNIKNSQKRYSGGFRKYLRLGFITGLMIISLSLYLVNTLSDKPANVENVVERQSLANSSSANPENLASGCSLSLLLSAQEDSNNLATSLSLIIKQNDIEIVTASYEDDTNKDKEEVKDKDKNKEKDQKDEDNKSKSSKSAIPDDELQYQLAKLIDAEGSIVDDYSQQLIAYCFLNRMRSNHWANSFDGVLNDGRGYAKRTRNYVANPNNVPSERALKNSKICLENYYAGTIPVPYNLVFQAGFKQGTVYYYDTTYGVYFCLADRLEPN